MIWLAWRQHRISFLAGAATIAVVIALLVLSGSAMRAEFTRLGLDACSLPTDSSCTEATRSFLDQFQSYQLVVPLLLLAPALVGVFWGAPLVAREVEHGTHRMVWMQSVSRRRWLLTKAAFLALATVVALGILTWVVNWWIAPLMDARPQMFDPGIFDLLGLAPVAYGLAALMLGIAAGAFSRKLVPAIALTLVLFVVLRVGVEVGVRPHFMEPVRGDFALPLFEPDVPPLPTGWMLLLKTVDDQGRLVSEGVGIEQQAMEELCPEAAAQERAAEGAGGGPTRAPTASDGPGARCARALGFHVTSVYHPVDRYWRFQITEAVLYLALSGALLAGSLWWIRHRIS
jgi:hypothetical protein